MVTSRPSRAMASDASDSSKHTRHPRSRITRSPAADTDPPTTVSADTSTRRPPSHTEPATEPWLRRGSPVVRTIPPAVPAGPKTGVDRTTLTVGPSPPGGERSTPHDEPQPTRHAGGAGRQQAPTHQHPTPPDTRSSRHELQATKPNHRPRPPATPAPPPWLLRRRPDHHPRRRPTVGGVIGHDELRIRGHPSHHWLRGRVAVSLGPKKRRHLVSGIGYAHPLLDLAVRKPSLGRERTVRRPRYLHHMTPITLTGPRAKT